MSCEMPEMAILCAGIKHEGQSVLSLEDLHETFQVNFFAAIMLARGLIDELEEQEREVSYQRRLLHGKIDILRAELVNRLRKKDETGELIISGADVQQLTDILAGRVPASEPE